MIKDLIALIDTIFNGAKEGGDAVVFIILINTAGFWVCGLLFTFKMVELLLMYLVGGVDLSGTL